MKVVPTSVLKFMQETVKTARIDELGQKVYDKVGCIEFPDGTRTYGLLDTAIKLGLKVDDYSDHVVDFTV